MQPRAAAPTQQLRSTRGRRAARRRPPCRHAWLPQPAQRGIAGRVQAGGWPEHMQRRVAAPLLLQGRACAHQAAGAGGGTARCRPPAAPAGSPAGACGSPRAACAQAPRLCGPPACRAPCPAARQRFASRRAWCEPGGGGLDHRPDSSPDSHPNQGVVAAEPAIAVGQERQAWGSRSCLLHLHCRQGCRQTGGNHLGAHASWRPGRTTGAPALSVARRSGRCILRRALPVLPVTPPQHGSTVALLDGSISVLDSHECLQCGMVHGAAVRGRVTRPAPPARAQTPTAAPSPAAPTGGCT